MDKRIDQYIAKSVPFVRPILSHIRDVVHKACPGVEETIKWGFPHFEYAGEILCNMASFKNYCSFGFWKASILPDPDGILQIVGKTSMGSLGQLRSLEDLPSDKILTRYIKAAAELNEKSIRVPARTKTGAKKELMVPDDFLKALSKNKQAKKSFDEFSTTNKREYVDWITEAKTGETRERRLTTSIEWLTEGKIRNWKYVKK
jgi:uncharacterized protein YdeI (YjbR/CyaY-like superfamily)